MTPHRSPYKISELQRHLTSRDLDLLRSIETFRLLTTGQIRRLHFTDHLTANAATRTTVRVLGRLEGHGLIVRLRRRIGGIDKGSAANVWQLAATGERLLRTLSGDPSRRRFVEPTEPFAQHTLAIAEQAIRLIEGAQGGGHEVLALETEPDCWRRWVGPTGTTQWLKPDLFVVTADANFESHAYVEVDRDTEHLPAIVRKCLAYQRYWATGIEQANADLFPAVVWVVPTAGRADRILTAIRSESALRSELFHVVTNEKALEVLGPEPTAQSSTQPKGGTP